MNLRCFFVLAYDTEPAQIRQLADRKELELRLTKGKNRKVEHIDNLSTELEKYIATLSEPILMISHFKQDTLDRSYLYNTSSKSLTYFIVIWEDLSQKLVLLCKSSCPSQTNDREN